MRRPGRLFVLFLLLSVVLNLADWPYIDEIFGCLPRGVISEVVCTHSQAKDAAPAAVAHKVSAGYQLLVGLHVIPSESPLLFPDPQSDKAMSAAPLVFVSWIPPTVDRPPS